MTKKLNTTLRQAMAAAVGTYLVNKGSGNESTLSIYTGSQPTAADDAPTGTLLCEIVFLASGVPYFTGGSGADLVLVTPISGTPSDSGVPGWARMETLPAGAVDISDGILDSGPLTLRMDGTIGTVGTDFIIDTSPLVNGIPFNLTGFTIHPTTG